MEVVLGKKMYLGNGYKDARLLHISIYSVLSINSPYTLKDHFSVWRLYVLAFDGCSKHF